MVCENWKRCKQYESMSKWTILPHCQMVGTINWTQMLGKLVENLNNLNKHSLHTIHKSLKMKRIVKPDVFRLYLHTNDNNNNGGGERVKGKKIANKRQTAIFYSICHDRIVSTATFSPQIFIYICLSCHCTLSRFWFLSS